MTKMNIDSQINISEFNNFQMNLICEFNLGAAWFAFFLSKCNISATYVAS